MDMDPDVISHINGGTTGVSVDEVKKLVENTPYALEIVHCGNPRLAIETVRFAMASGAEGRLIIGNDSPTGSGVISLGILRMLSFLSMPDTCPPGAGCLYGHGQRGPHFRP